MCELIVAMFLREFHNYCLSPRQEEPKNNAVRINFNLAEISLQGPNRQLYEKPPKSFGNLYAFVKCDYATVRNCLSTNKQYLGNVRKDFLNLYKP